MADVLTPTAVTTSRTNPGYTWVSEIAKGGLGTVSLVLRRDGTFQRLYALKRLHPHLLDDAEVRRMFMEEARLAGLLRHPNVVGVLDVGADDQGPFLVMEYVEGVSLATAVKTLRDRAELVPIHIVVDVARQTAEGLRAAHELVADDGTPTPIVHRDISPQNILLGFDGSARLTDFGIAKALGGDGQTTTNMLKGKFGYMSPEQLQFSRLDVRADLFSLGIVMWELATARRLFPGRALEQTAARILNDPPPELLPERGDAPAELERILFGLLAKDRDTRTPSAADLVAQLNELAGELPVEDEEEADLRSFLTSRFGDLRETATAQRAIAVKRAAERVDDEPVELVVESERPPVKRVSTMLVAVAVLCGVLVGAGALFAAQSLGEPAESAGSGEETTAHESADGTATNAGSAAATALPADGEAIAATSARPPDSEEDGDSEPVSSEVEETTETAETAETAEEAEASEATRTPRRDRPRTASQSARRQRPRMGKRPAAVRPDSVDPPPLSDWWE